MISVIVPFYNAEEYLLRCIESLWQDGDFEFIFVDDKSTDKGADIVRLHEKADKRFKLIKNEHKKGVSGARNTGLDHAEGEWIVFADADDEFMPNAYDILTSAIKEADANVYQLNHYRYYTKIRKLVLKYTNSAGEYSAQSIPEFHMWNAVWNKVFKQEFLKDIRFNEKLQSNEDTMFVLECLSKENRIYQSEQKLYKRRFDNPQSLSRTKTEADLFKYVRELEAFIKKQKDSEIRQVCCKILSDAWKSDLFVKLIGHRE